MLQAKNLLKILLSLALAIVSTTVFADSITTFTPGSLVIDTVSGSALDAASPITLKEFSLSANGKSAAQVGDFTLPQSPSGSNSAISGEYGSASEGIPNSIGEPTVPYNCGVRSECRNI